MRIIWNSFAAVITYEIGDKVTRVRFTFISRGKRPDSGTQAPPVWVGNLKRRLAQTPLGLADPESYLRSSCRPRVKSCFDHVREAAAQVNLWRPRKREEADNGCEEERS